MLIVDQILLVAQASSDYTYTWKVTSSDGETVASLEGSVVEMTLDTTGK
jgi:hypothetical protein